AGEPGPGRAPRPDRMQGHDERERTRPDSGSGDGPPTRPRGPRVVGGAVRRLAAAAGLQPAVLQPLPPAHRGLVLAVRPADPGRADAVPRLLPVPAAPLPA